MDQELAAVERAANRLARQTIGEIPRLCSGGIVRPRLADTDTHPPLQQTANRRERHARLNLIFQTHSVVMNITTARPTKPREQFNRTKVRASLDRPGKLQSHQGQKSI